MKNLKVFATLFFSMLVLFASPCSLRTFAAETDALEITITADKENYSTGDTVKLNVNVKNNNSYTIDSLSLEGSISDNFTISENKNYSMKLEPSESKDYTITAKQNNQDSPQTGVTPPIIPAVLLGASLVFVTFTLINNKKARKMLAVVLCVTSISGFCFDKSSFKAIAAEYITVTKESTFKYNNKDITAKITAKYEDMDVIIVNTKPLGEKLDDGSYNVTEVISTLDGTLRRSNEIKEFSYKITDTKSTIVAEGKLPVAEKWVIENFGLVVGGNYVELTAVDNNNKVYVKKLSILNYNAENMNNTNADLTDDDNDELPAYYENWFGTDSANQDSDNDGLPDGYEVKVTKTNPLEKDSDSNGVSDGDEDFDNDSLKNIDEYNYKSEPFYSDFDLDDLDDYNEIHVHKTNPNESDTDSDGLSDGLEIKYNMNPLVQDTLSDGILDGNRIFNVKETGWDYTEQDTVKPVLDIELKGTQIETLSIGKVDDDNLFLNSSISGYLGNAYEFNVDESFDKATLTFEISEEYFNDPEFIPAIYHWDEEKQCLNELENQTIKNNSVSAPIEHFSKYIVIAKNKYEESLFEFEILAPTDQEMQTQTFDLALVLDESGSISDSNYSLMKKLASELVNKLDDEDNIALFTFDDIITKQSGFVNKKDAADKILNLKQSKGMTAIYSAINAANNEFKLNSSNKATKIMIVLTDGLDNSSSVSASSVTKDAVNNNIVIYTVGVGSVNTNVLTSISNSTGGAYYSAANFSQLEGIFEKLQVDVDLYRDSDTDGISDYHEKKIAAGELKLGSGATLTNFKSLNYMNPDSDNDGLTDGQEFKIEAQFVKGQNVYYCCMTSFPCLDDSDSDGYLDAQDNNPLIWDVSDRDLAISAAISYSFIPAGSELDNLSDYWSKDLNKRLFDLAYAEELKGWKVLDTWYAYGGLQILALQNGNKIIVANRGTEPGGGDAWELFADWFNNATTYLLGISTQTPAAKKFMKKTMKNNPGCEFYVTGHSLGGHLTYNAAAKGIDYNSSAIKAIVTFNGLGLTFGGFGLGDVFDEEQLLKKSSVIRNYMVENDPVSKGLLGATTVHYGTNYTYEMNRNAPDEHSLYTFLSLLDPLKRAERVLH